MKSCYRPPSGTGCSPWPFDKEVPVFNHSCGAAGGAGSSACVMSHFWSGGAWGGYEHSRLRYYVDGEANASVSFPLGLGKCLQLA